MASLESGVQRAGNLILGSERKTIHKRADSMVRNEGRRQHLLGGMVKTAGLDSALILSENDKAMDTLLS